MHGIEGKLNFLEIMGNDEISLLFCENELRPNFLRWSSRNCSLSGEEVEAVHPITLLCNSEQNN